jgi:hypothetical protein
MTNRERLAAVLRYRRADRMPVVHFGFWGETLEKWAAEGHISAEEARQASDGNAVETRITAALGFDLNYQSMFYTNCSLDPGFETKVVAELPDGSRHVRNGLGVVIVQKPGAGAIPSEISHLLTSRAGWVEHYAHRMVWKPVRVDGATVNVDAEPGIPFEPAGRARLAAPRDNPVGLHCGGVWGPMRDIVGLENLSYLLADDPGLVEEIVDTLGMLGARNAERALATEAVYDFGHFWEDICFKGGPLVSPATFRAVAGPRYRRITDILARHDIDLVSLDCDGKIDELIPVWLDNGVNVMFPIEVGTWEASIAPWRKRFGRDLRGVGGVDKKVFARDRAAVDAEIERMKPLVDLGGYVPCMDHRLPPDAKWDLVRYYAERFRSAFSG